MAKTPEDVASTRNLILNGALDFWQRVGGNTTTFNTASVAGNYTTDRFQNSVVGATTKNYSIVRSTNVPTLAQSGFQSTYAYLWSALNTPTLVGSDQVNPFQYRMEGLDYENIHTKTITLQFWFNASLAGTYSVSFRNSAGNRSYVTTFTQNAGSTWEFKSVSLTLDTTGTWLFDNTVGMIIDIASFGQSNVTSTLSAWQAGNFTSANTASNYFISGNSILIAQVSLYYGLGTGQYGFRRSGGSIGDELGLCQRYYEKSYSVDAVPGTTADNGIFIAFNLGTNQANGPKFIVDKRAVPGTVHTYHPTLGTTDHIRGFTSTTDFTVTSFGSTSTKGIFQVNATLGSEVTYYYWIADSEL